MTQFAQFVPSNYSAPTVQVTLDGVLYRIVVTWNIAAQRYYINVYSVLNGALVCAVPLIETPPGVNIASLTWDQNRGEVVATVEPPLINAPDGPVALAQPTWRPVGQVVQYTITNCEPVTYNGVYDCLTINDSTFSYPMATDPGEAVVLGSVTRYLDMIGPWFNSTLIFRNMQFEANP